MDYILYLLIIAYVIFKWRMILDAWNNEPESRWSWILLMVFIIPFGAFVYYFAKKRGRDKLNKKYKSTA